MANHTKTAGLTNLFVTDDQAISALLYSGVSKGLEASMSTINLVNTITLVDTLLVVLQGCNVEAVFVAHETLLDSFLQDVDAQGFN